MNLLLLVEDILTFYVSILWVYCLILLDFKLGTVIESLTQVDQVSGTLNQSRLSETGEHKEFGVMQGNSFTPHKGKQNTMHSEGTTNID